MTTDKQREAFNDWRRLQPARETPFPYDIAWAAWQAATAELENIRRENEELRALVERLKVVTKDDACSFHDDLMQRDGMLRKWKDMWQSQQKHWIDAITAHITRKLGETK